MTWVDFKIFSTHGEQLNKCIFSHLTWPMTNWCLFLNRVYEWYFMLFFMFELIKFWLSSCPVLSLSLPIVCNDELQKDIELVIFKVLEMLYLTSQTPLTWPALPPCKIHSKMWQSHLIYFYCWMHHNARNTFVGTVRFSTCVPHKQEKGDEFVTIWWNICWDIVITQKYIQTHTSPLLATFNFNL